MEQYVLTKWELENFSVNDTDEAYNIQTLAVARSLIRSPSTSEQAISVIFKTLAHLLQLNNNNLTIHHVIKLLSDLAFHRTHLAHPIFDVIRSYLLLCKDECTKLATYSLAALVSVACHDHTLCSAMDEISEGLFLLLCFRPCVSVRLWLLLNAERFHIRPYLLVTVLLGFTKDPYPYLRKASLDGLSSLRKAIDVEDRGGVIEGCYFRAVELLEDSEDCVRSAAVGVVSEYGLMLIASNQETIKTDWSNAVFFQLCSVVRDMNVEVRMKAFDALGNVAMVSEDFLLQTLSKKVLGIIKENKAIGQCSEKEFELLVLNAAGAFMHGLEDEFYGVRRSACRSLGYLAVLSAKFASEALNLLMDVLNDDTRVVRLQTLEVMHHMASYGHLKLQETHMHMFLGTLVDNCISIRSATRKVLQVSKLSSSKLFESSANALLESLEIYPQDEAHVLSVLFNIGKHHGSFAACFINKHVHELEPSWDGKVTFDSARFAALLILAISASISGEPLACNIPPKLFSYAVAFLGRLSHVLGDFMDQNALLSYLVHCSASPPEFNLREKELFLSLFSGDIRNPDSGQISGGPKYHLKENSNCATEFESDKLCDHIQTENSLVEDHLLVNEEVSSSLKLILGQVKNVWPLIQSGYTVEVLRSLRVFKEELATWTTNNALQTDGNLAFTLCYISLLKLFAKAWVHFSPSRKFPFHKIGGLNMLAKLDRKLRELRCRFIGLSEEQEYHILELSLFTYIMRLSEPELCCQFSTLKKFSATLLRLELLSEKKSIQPSKLVIEFKKFSTGIGSLSNASSFDPLKFKNLLEFFSLGQLTMSGDIKQLKAELGVPNNGSENPIPFISGLPVGLKFEVALYNISVNNRLWLSMAVNEKLTQYVFLDLSQFGRDAKIRKFTYTAPFYRTPKAVSFTTRVCVGMECLFEDANVLKRSGGPTHELTYLCKEKEVHLSKHGGK